MHIYLIAILVALVLIVILFFTLKSTVKRIDENTKKYFVDKLQDYDYLIDEKQQVLNKLNEEIEKNKKTLSETKIVHTEEKKQELKRQFSNSQYVAKYIDEDLFKKYKDIKERFSFDYNKVIKDFLSTKLTDNDSNYNTLISIRKKFSKEQIYKIIITQKKDQKKFLDEFLTTQEKDILKKYINLNNIKVRDFVIKLDTIIEKIDPNVYVLTGDKNLNYDNLSPLVKTIYKEDINEGIKINYKGNIYDYSL